MWSKNFPFPFPFPFYYFYQYPIPAATSSRGPSLLPKDGETIEHELSLQSIVTQQCHPEQPYPRNRNSVRLSVREKQRRKRVHDHRFRIVRITSNARNKNKTGTSAPTSSRTFSSSLGNTPVSLPSYKNPHPHIIGKQSLDSYRN